jgi:purine-binding chemotaxis protein CheW
MKRPEAIAMTDVQTPKAAVTAPVDASPGVQQCLRFSIGPETCAVRVELVREILEVGQMTPLPLMPSFVCGVMNLRGVVVPVIDLAARLGMAATQMGRRTCVVIVDLPGSDGDAPLTLGVLVEVVHEVFDTLPGEAEPVPRLGMRIEPGFVRGILRVRGVATPELDFPAILHHEELARLIRAATDAH